MKAEELMIGDWVLWHDKYVQIASVSGITYSFGQQDVVLAHCNKEQILEKHITKSIQPIPLKVIHLTKNGFKAVDADDMEFVYNDGYEIRVIIDEGFKELGVEPSIFLKIDFAEKSLVMPIEYVHELQHAMKLYGIDKEIVL